MEEKNLQPYDFGHDIIPYMVKSNMPVHAYKFEDKNKKAFV